MGDVTSSRCSPPASTVARDRTEVDENDGADGDVGGPVMVGVTSFVVRVGGPSMETSGSTVSTVSVWVALPGLPAPSVTAAETTVYCAFGRRPVVTDQVPPEGVAVIGACPVMLTVMTEGATMSVVPEIVGVVFVVITVAPPVIVTTGGVE